MDPLLEGAQTLQQVGRPESQCRAHRCDDFCGRATLVALELDGLEAQHPVPGQYVHPPFGGRPADHAAGHTAGPAARRVHRSRPADDERVSVDVGEGARERLGQRAHKRIHVLGRPAPVDLAVRRHTRASVRRGALVLRCARVAAEVALDGGCEMDSLQLVEPRIQVGDRVVAADRHCLLEQDPAGVEPGSQDVDRDGGIGAAVDDRPVDRGTAAELGQRCVVHVDEGAPIEQRRGQDPVVRGHHHAVWSQIAHRRLDRRDGGIGDHRHAVADGARSD